MAEKPSYEELEQAILRMGKELERLAHLEGINNALYRIANAINMTTELDELFKIIHRALSPIIDTTNFYISLYDRTNDSLTFPYIVDTVDLCYPPVIEVSKTASLTAEVIRSKQPLLITKAEILARRETRNLSIPACTPAEIWLGVPLKTQEEIIGVMAVQNYQDPHCYDDADINILVAVADQVAIVLRRQQAEKSLREKVDELRQAADQIKTLRGIVPICMHCKKIRDDRGFWNQVEVYVRNHTEAEFSHGVCPDCVKLLYPDYQ